jgi:hypothetical protein
MYHHGQGLITFLYTPAHLNLLFAHPDPLPYKLVWQLLLCNAGKVCVSAFRPSTIMQGKTLLFPYTQTSS